MNREEAIAILKESNIIDLANGNTKGREAVDMAIEALTATVPGWIPCSKNSMPPWNEEVIVTVMDDSGDTPFEYTCSAWWFQDKIWISDNDIVFGEVIAWMPLPKPYKEEDND